MTSRPASSNNNWNVLVSKTFSLAFNQQRDNKFTSPPEIKQEQPWENGKDNPLEQGRDKTNLREKNSENNTSLQKFPRKLADETKDNAIFLRNGMPYSDGERRTCRKRYKPTRSADKCDPNFRGVVFCLHTRMQGDESRLAISSYFCNVKTPAGSPRSRYSSGSAGYYGDQWSCSDDENRSPYHRDFILCPRDRERHEDGVSYRKEGYVMVKACASCGTRRTPMWRDAEDGTPLCNACGIRFKKYKVRCSQCWHIPKKDIKTFPNCPSCGATLRMSVCRRTW